MIFPIPKQESYSEGKYHVKNYMEGLDLCSFYEKYKTNSDDVTLICNKSFGEEQYELIVDEHGIKITHRGECGIFRALTSLKQLFDKNGASIPFCQIDDSPDFERRGYMLDISRGKVPKPDAIIRLIDMLALLKYNELQLYMDNFVYEYEAFPQVTEGIECLTAEDIKRIDKYCKKNFIDLVPNQNSFGHMEQWLKRDDFKHLKVGKEVDAPSSTLNPLLPESYEFIDKIYESLLPNFSSEYVHIGFDEAFELGKYELKEPCEKYGKEKIFMDWLCKISELVKTKYHKKPQFWADMIYKHPETYKRIPENSTAVVWAYDQILTAQMEEHCVDLAQKGIDFYVCPGDSVWKSLTGRFDLMQFNLRHVADVGKKHGAKGYLVTSWGSGCNVHFPVWTYVGCALGALYAWNPRFPDGTMRMDDVGKAEEYVDTYIFKTPLSKYLRRLQRYYLLEDERVSDSTFSMKTFNIPLEDTSIYNFPELFKYTDVIEMDMIIEYVNRNCKEIEKMDFNEDFKEQIFCNTRMVVFIQKFNKIRIEKTATVQEIEELIQLANDILVIYNKQWDKDNFSNGKELFINIMNSRKNELEKFKAQLAR